ncbi:IS5 family transposase [Ochrobactrum sp. AN78]|uniref:IS5 family transposase n=1 Tax=Ochrobactrum sp. AN78 TaxID=3039853 RepID=UPI002989C410|nr:IS5 family transposase [Ochrobactrum sp. AN78]MDH7791185.1 transposase [Ochrobactrum sp. AN78]
MAWTETARRDYARRGLRYASDCTDDEWAIIAPLLQPMGKVDRPREHNPRKLWNAIQYIATTGCQWAQLSKEFTTVQYHFYGMRDNGLLDLINEMLVAVTRLAEGRKVEPTAAGGPRGYDAGKKIKGRKRHIVTDMSGDMLEGIVHGGDVQDRDGAPDLIERTCQTYPTVAKLFADGGYAGEKLAIEIVKRSDQAKGFVILSRRWIVERTFAWLNRCRRLAKDWETSIASSEAWIFISSIRRMTRRIAKLEF